MKINKKNYEIENIRKNGDASEMLNVFIITIKIIGPYGNFKNILDDVENNVRRFCCF